MPREPRLATPVWLARFLDPRYAAANHAGVAWQAEGRADTPGADARCCLRIAFDVYEDAGRIRQAAFSVFGPPVAIACADWACEWLEGRTIEAARGLSIQDFEQALVLAPRERYAAVLIIDALAEALVKARVNL